MKDSIENPINGSLVSISANIYQNITCDKQKMSKIEVMHQIPHWVFPIGSAIHTSVPRLLTYSVLSSCTQYAAKSAALCFNNV